MLLKFHRIFGDQFLRHIAFIFTRWSNNKKDIYKRKKEGSSEELKINDINK